MRLPQLRQRLRDLGAAPCHEGRVLRAWAQGRSLDTKRRRAEDFLPLAVRDELPGLFDELDALARVHSAHAGDDGSTRLLVALADGQIQSTSLSSVQQAVASRPHATLSPDGSLGMVAWVDNGDSMAYSASYTPAGGWAQPLTLGAALWDTEVMLGSGPGANASTVWLTGDVTRFLWKVMGASYLP